MRRLAGLATLLVLAASGRATAAERPWTEVRSPHFQVLTDAGEKTGRQVALRFEQIRAAFAMLGSKARLDPGQPLVVIAARDERSLERLLPAYFAVKTQARPAGVFLPLPQRMYVVLQVEAAEDEESRHSVLFHEYVHLLHSLNFRTLPVWLAEGLAEFYAHTTVQASRVLVGRPAPYHVALLRDRRLIPMAEFFTVDRDSPHYNEADRVSMFYAQAWAMTHWLLLGDKGANRPKLQAFMDHLAKGATPADAARDAFGPPEQVRSVLDAYLLKHAFYMQTLPPLALEPSAFATRTLPPGEIAGWRALLHVAFDRKEDARRDIAEALRLGPDVAVGHEANAQLLTREARLPEARAAAAAAIERDPRNVPALVLAGTLARMPGGQGAAEAVQRLEAAVAAAPEHALALASLAEARAAAGAPAAETLALARRAVDAWPSNLRIRSTFAAQLSHHGEHTRALAEAQQILAMATTEEEKAAGRLVVESVKAASAPAPKPPPAAAAGEALARERASCDGGDMAACAKAGVMLEEGRGAAADPAAAVALYRKACEAANVEGCFRLGMAHEFGSGAPKDAGQALALYERACASAHTYACTGVGDLLAYGRGPSKDDARAADMYEKACDAGHAMACGRLGTMLRLGRGRGQDLARAYDLYARGCSGRDPSSCEEQGQSHAHSRGTARDLNRAIELFDRACAMDPDYGCVPLGQWLGMPEVGRDYARAAKALGRACQEAGDQRGCAGLAALLMDGLGVPQDAARARGLATTACEKNAFEGCALLGAMHAPEEPAKAAGYFEKACEGGLLPTCTELALHHLGGRGVPQSMPKARALFTRACEGGEGRACNSLADLLQYGDGDKDPARVAALRKKACAAGYPPACAR